MVTFYHRNPSSRHDIFGSTFEREIENKSHKTITRVSQEPDSLNIPKLGDLALNNNLKTTHHSMRRYNLLVYWFPWRQHIIQWEDTIYWFTGFPEDNTSFNEKIQFIGLLVSLKQDWISCLNNKNTQKIYSQTVFLYFSIGSDHMIVGFTSTCEISVYKP